MSSRNTVLSLRELQLSVLVERARECMTRVRKLPEIDNYNVNKQQSTHAKVTRD